VVSYPETLIDPNNSYYSDATTFVCHMTKLYYFFPDFMKLHIVQKITFLERSLQFRYFDVGQNIVQTLLEYWILCT